MAYFMGVFSLIACRMVRRASVVVLIIQRRDSNVTGLIIYPEDTAVLVSGKYVLINLR
jgi:hypothetical protein